MPIPGRTGNFPTPPPFFFVPPQGGGGGQPVFFEKPGGGGPPPHRDQGCHDRDMAADCRGALYPAKRSTLRSTAGPELHGLGRLSQKRARPTRVAWISAVVWVFHTHPGPTGAKLPVCLLSRWPDISCRIVARGINIGVGYTHVFPWIPDDTAQTPFADPASNIKPDVPRPLGRTQLDSRRKSRWRLSVDILSSGRERDSVPRCLIHCHSLAVVTGMLPTQSRQPNVPGLSRFNEQIE